MMTNGKIAAAVVGGYLLGRTGKGKLALSLGMMLAGRKLSLNPQDLAKTVAGSPLLSGLSDQVRKDLVEGTKSAAGSALEARMNSLADSLHDRSAELEGGPGDEDDERAEDDGEAPGDSDSDGEQEAEREAPPARTAKKKTAKTTKTAAKSTASRPAKATRSRPAKRTSAKTTRGGRDE